MIVTCNKQKYNYYINCLTKFAPSYCEKIKSTLVIDNALHELGFINNAPYTFNVEIAKKDIQKILKTINGYYKTNYDLFEEYVEFYNLLKELLNS